MIKGFSRFVCIVTIIGIFIIGIFIVPRLFKIVPFMVCSASMEPEIPTGSVIFVNKNDTNVEVGDIITFGLKTGTTKIGTNKGVYVTHRVNQISSDGMIQTKGDANDSPDGWLSPDAVTGTMLFYIPHLGYLLDGLQQHHRYLLVVISICILNGISLILLKILDEHAVQ